MNEHRPTAPASATPNHHAGADLATAIADNLKEVEQGVAPALQHLVEQASDLTRAGLDAMHTGSTHLHEQARRSGDRTLDYIRHEPVKAVLLAAAAGALTVAVIDLLRQRTGAR